MSGSLDGKVAVVAGGTRGASRAIAVELARNGAFVYVTGRTSGTSRSEVDRPETIEGTVEAITAAGGAGAAVRVDHLEPDQVRGLAQRVDDEQGRLDVLVNGLWGGDVHLQWGKPVWEHSLEASLRTIHLGLDSHVITSHHLLPLMIRRPGGLLVEMTDGTESYNARFRKGTSLAYYVAKAGSHLLTRAQADELAPHGAAAVGVTPGWLRSEAMLSAYRVSEENWHAALAVQPHFGISETPAYVARGVAALAADPEKLQFSGRTLDSFGLARRYGITDVDGSRPDAWRYLVEVQDPGKPADPTGYR